MDNPFESPAILSFCPGILGLERGIKRAIGKLNVVAYVEIEAFIIANLVAGMEAGLVDSAPIWTDAKTFDARPFRGRIHGIIGGYPCTPFSLAGTRSGENHPGHIYPAISRAIEATRPIWGFFENVDDHLSLGFDKVYQDLHRMGYAVETGIYTAEEVGAPHERERMFIFALENSYCQRLRESGVLMQQQGRTEIISGGEVMANSNGSSAVGGLGNILQAGSEDEREARERERGRNEFENSSEALANTLCNYGTEIQIKERQSIIRPEFISNGNTGRDEWPTGQGYYQHPWEEPRTIESGMGVSIDGYNFREDLLRALGNSVVEQTAELAFKDLLNKHLKNLCPAPQP